MGSRRWEVSTGPAAGQKGGGVSAESLSPGCRQSSLLGTQPSPPLVCHGPFRTGVSSGRRPVGPGGREVPEANVKVTFERCLLLLLPGTGALEVLPPRPAPPGGGMRSPATAGGSVSTHQAPGGLVPAVWFLLWGVSLCCEGHPSPTHRVPHPAHPEHPTHVLTKTGRGHGGSSASSSRIGTSTRAPAAAGGVCLEVPPCEGPCQPAVGRSGVAHAPPSTLQTPPAARSAGPLINPGEASCACGSL